MPCIMNEGHFMLGPRNIALPAIVAFCVTKIVKVPHQDKSM